MQPDNFDHLSTDHIINKISQLGKEILKSPSRPTPDLNTGDPAFLGVSASSIQPQQLQWLWHNRIPRGQLIILEGDPGLGKSLITIDLAARITTGQLMPDGTPGLQGSVILISLEDSQASTLVPRLTAAGANLDHIRLLSFVETYNPKLQQTLAYPFTLPKHLTTLARTIHHTQPALVVIDPLMAALATKVNAFSDQNIRQLLIPLAKLAERSNCAILIVRHLTKSTSHNPLYRGSGSIGIIGHARTGLLVTHHPSDENKRILASIKNNLSEKADNLTYEVIANSYGIPSIHWLGTNYIPILSLMHNSPHLSLERQAILAVLKISPIPLGPKDIAEQTGQDHKRVRQTLRRMLHTQEIASTAYGLYTCHDASFSSSHLPNKSTMPATPATVSHPDSNFASPVIPSPPLDPATTILTPQPSLEATTEELRLLLHCSHRNHSLHWLFSPTKIGCPICDTWTSKDSPLYPTLLALSTTLAQHLFSKGE